jgi:hypothetical protein
MKTAWLVLGVSWLLAGSAVAAPGDFVRVSGAVGNDSTDRLTVLRASDGRTWKVDARNADRGPKTRQLKPGQTVTVLGAEGARPDELRAYVVDVFDSTPVLAVPGTPVKGGPWYRVVGTVQNIQGPTLSFKGDDGKTLAVEMRSVDPQLKDRLMVGQRIMLVGHLGTQSSRFIARYAGPPETTAAAAPPPAPPAPPTVTPAAPSGAAASAPPPADGPADKDDCKKGGWRTYTSLAFKNQGDCVSWVNKHRR